MKKKPTRKTEKPEVRIVVMSDGKIRIINGLLGAKFCGVKPQSFAAYLRRQYAKPKTRRRAVSVAARIRNAYPELFSAKPMH